MSSIFDKQVGYTSDKMRGYIDKVKANPMLVNLASKPDCKEMFLAGSDEVRLQLLSIAKQEFIGKVTPVAYASVTYVLACLLGIDVDVYAGVGFPNNYPNREKELAIYNERKQTDEHPLVPTTVFLTVVESGTMYEYFNGEISSEHIDSVKLDLNVEM